MTTDERILDEIEECDLDENLQFFAEIIGLDNVKLLIRNAGGARFYIPKTDKFKTKALEKYLHKNISSISTKSKCRLERLFGLSSVTVNEVTKRVINSNPNQYKLNLD